MQDIPVFTTENGVASLILKEIPYKSIAYVRIQNTLSPKELMEECISFCRAVGAEAVYASGHAILEQYPLYTQILEMRCERKSLPDTDAALFPVQEKTIEIWREQYNNRMHDVANSAYMTIKDGEEMLKRGDGYFIHQGGELLGIGIAAGDRIDAVVSLKRGAGKAVVLALAHALTADLVRLEVASANERAVSLYERLGFICTRECSRWYKIF